MEDPISEAPPADLGEGVVHPTISQDLSAQNSFATPLGNLGPEEPPVEQVPPTAGQLASPTPQGGAAAVEAKPAPKSKDPSPQRGRQVKSTRSSGGGAADLSKNWNPYVSKPVDTSLALKKPGSVHNEPAARPQGARKAPSSPTREERQKRKQWAEAAAKRQAEAARRILEAEAKLKAEQEARMEARRAAVRARIEQEKEAQARLAAKRAALVKPPEEHQQPKEGEAPVAEDPKHAMRKRATSPRPLYIRLQEEYEKKVQMEEEETKKKLEMKSAIRQVRVQALMNGEVVIRPLPDERPPPKDDTNTARWNPAYRSITSPQRDQRRASAGGDEHAGTDSEAQSPTSRRARHLAAEQNGMVLYSMRDEDGAAGAGDGHQHPLGAGGNRWGKLVTRRDRDNNTGRQRFGNPRRVPMVDRACSPFILDPASQQPINVPPQHEFWNKPTESKGAGAPGAKRVGALEQAPPPPPASRIGAKAAAADKGGDKHGASQDGEMPAPEQLAQVIGDEASMQDAAGLTAEAPEPDLGASMADSPAAEAPPAEAAEEPAAAKPVAEPEAPAAEPEPEPAAAEPEPAAEPETEPEPAEQEAPAEEPAAAADEPAAEEPAAAADDADAAADAPAEEAA